MRYQIRVAGKVFEGNDHRNLLKRAVEAKRQAVRKAGCELHRHSLIEPPPVAAGA